MLVGRGLGSGAVVVVAGGLLGVGAVVLVCVVVLLLVVVALVLVCVSLGSLWLVCGWLLVWWVLVVGVALARRCSLAKIHLQGIGSARSLALSWLWMC